MNDVESRTVGNNRELALAERILKLAEGDDRAERRARRLLAHLQALPMATILAKVPGATVAEKAEKVGVSRQTYYYWLGGQTRPNEIQAKKISRITGYTRDVIRGIA